MFICVIRGRYLLFLPLITLICTDYLCSSVPSVGGLFSSLPLILLILLILFVFICVIRGRYLLFLPLISLICTDFICVHPCHLWANLSANIHTNSENILKFRARVSEKWKNIFNFSELQPKFMSEGHKSCKSERKNKFFLIFPPMRYESIGSDGWNFSFTKECDLSHRAEIHDRRVKNVEWWTLKE